MTTVDIDQKTRQCISVPRHEKEAGYIPAAPCKHNFTNSCHGCRVFGGNDDLPLLFTA